VPDRPAPVSLPDTPEEAGDTESGEQQDEEPKHRGVPSQAEVGEIDAIER
jgi:hypothetical protein